MPTDLLELLKARSIVHPSQIDRATFEGARLTVVTRGYPWWVAESERGTEGSLELVFEGVSWGCLDCLITDPQNDEALETLEVHSLEKIDWAQPAVHNIYCSGPMPDPIALYACLEVYLEEAGAFMSPGNFLNPGTIYHNADFTLHRFAEIVSSNSYLVARGPDSIRQLLCDELERQGVPHNVHTFEFAPDRRLWVRLGEANFLCDRAVAKTSTP